MIERRKEKEGSEIKLKSSRATTRDSDKMIGDKAS